MVNTKSSCTLIFLASYPSAIFYLLLLNKLDTDVLFYPSFVNKSNSYCISLQY